MRCSIQLSLACLCLCLPLSLSEASADPALQGKPFIHLQTPPINKMQGMQGVVWVPEQKLFYSTWNRRNSDGSERVNVVRHDLNGQVVDYSETVGPGGKSPYSLGHGQGIDYLYANGVFTLVTDSGDSRGATFFEVGGSGKGWKLTNVRVYTLQPGEVRSGTVALSTDKSKLIKTGGPYKRGKNVRIWSVNALLSGPQGDRTNDGTSYTEIIQPNLALPNQGIALEGTKLKFLNGNNLVAGKQSVTDYDLSTRSIVASSELNKGIAPRSLNGAAPPQIGEPEGMFSVKGAGGRAFFWIGISRKDCSGRGYDSFVMPLNGEASDADLPDKCDKR